MKYLVYALASLIPVCGCGGAAAPLPACSLAIPSGASATVGPDGASACSEAGAVTAMKDSDLSVDGYTAVGSAYTFSGTGPFPHGIDFVLPYSTGKVSDDLGVVVLVKKGNWAAHAGALSNVVVEKAHAKVHFHSVDVATYQIAVRNTSGSKVTRHYTFRAVAGVSMGGFGSSVNFFLHPDRYDAIGVMGADPGPDMTYSLGMIHDLFFAGFCTAADGLDKIGQLCPPARQLLADQGEVGSTFEALNYQAGSGVGLTLSRSLYLRANRDLTRAMANAAYYNPDSPYLPPGVDPSTVALTPAEACATPTVLKNFYDWRYNPTGQYDVISFCDGNDSAALGLGKFDPSLPETDPAQILLAVDVNGNGKRDSGEPVIIQGYEPFDDVGTDGVADVDEPGYDPVTNPDPNGDDYHYLWNPTGTEKNWRYDEGEPYQDVGIDGVPMSVGGCQAQSGVQNCYDYGEGNGKFDYAPGLQAWRHDDPRTNLEALSADDVSRLDTWYDAGIRDFFNAQVSTNSLMAALGTGGAPVRVWDGFPAIVGDAQSNENAFNANTVDWPSLGRHVYVRYGDPDVSESVVESTGDGRHVGTATQAVHRAQSLLFYLANRWPDGDRAIAPVDSANSQIMGTFMSTAGRMSPYEVILPPGYTQPENGSKRYPVVYFMHGYGMDPMGIADIALIAQNAMVDDRQSDKTRMPKFIIVLVDGKCRPGGDVSQAPLPTSGDLCEEGTFYAEHPEGDAQEETELMELEDYIDANYRTKMPADLPFTE